MASDRATQRESLVTTASTALAMSPPRAPPYDSAHRMLLLGQDPSTAALATHHTQVEKDNHNHHDIRSHVMSILKRHHFDFQMPHPHLPAGPEFGDRVTRALGFLLPMAVQNRCRDSGAFRSISDGLVTASAPTPAVSNPLATYEFIRLTRECERLQYGKHPMQIIDLFLPEKGGKLWTSSQGLVFFVHGGAWGSGLPWLYRLVASPFLELDIAVAIVGYRTFPDADVNGQVDDIEHAALYLANRYPSICSESPGSIGNCLMGHSSGAHIAFLLLLKHLEEKIKKSRTLSSLTDKKVATMDFDSFVGMSGPYDISHHFDYEAGRGVEEISPMKPACGYSRKAFHDHSPALKLRQMLSSISESESRCLDVLFPRTLLVHGIEDSTVPFTATAEAARIVRSCGISRCDEIYLPGTGHSDTVMHLMAGGRSRDAIIPWLQTSSNRKAGKGSHHSLLRSKL